MYRWYVINTYSGHENKVKHNLEHRVQTMSQNRNVRQVVVPTEQVSEMKDGQKVQTEKRTMPGYVLVNMEMTDDAWGLVKNTPGVTGFVGSRNKPVRGNSTSTKACWTRDGCRGSLSIRCWRCRTSASWTWNSVTPACRC